MFPEILKELRKAAEMTQLALARRLHYAQNTICNWEKRKKQPSIQAMAQIAEIFDVSIEYLIGKANIYSKECFGYTLSKKEKDFLQTFKLLSSELQEQILNYMKSFSK